MTHYIYTFSYFALSQVDDSPTTREKVQEWFNDLIELESQYPSDLFSWKKVLDAAEVFFDCDISDMSVSDMSGENKNIHDWLWELYLEFYYGVTPCPPT